MKRTHHYFKLIFLFAGLCYFNLHAAPQTVAPTLSLLSTQGYQKFQKGMQPYTIALMTHFVTQDNPTFCGIASSVMVLNALGIQRPIDTVHPAYRYFTQQNIWNEKTAVFENGVLKKGLSLATLNNILSSYPVLVKPLFANQMNEAKFRQVIQESVAANQYVIVLFDREMLGQEGKGHVSPIGAYLPQTDEVLVLDVSRYKAEPFWVKMSVLWQAINTYDEQEKSYRGMLVVSQRSISQP